MNKNNHKNKKIFYIAIFISIAIFSSTLYLSFLPLSNRYFTNNLNATHSTQNTMSCNSNYKHTNSKTTTTIITELEEIINGIIFWKKGDKEYILNTDFNKYAGSTAADWFPIGIGRYGYQDDYQSFLSSLYSYVSQKYTTEDKLHKTKATEWHRISLAILAMGGNPKNVNGIDLISDGIYNRGYTRAIDAQGINGAIWGLITLDSLRYAIPNNDTDNSLQEQELKKSFSSREDLIVNILSRQLGTSEEQQGFALTGTTSDPDISAMAITALAPYYNSTKEYTYTNKNTKTQVLKTVRQVIDETITTLSLLQSDDGDYFSWGTANLESTAWVALSLASLNIDPINDSRFIKNGKTLLDGISKYRFSDGGFLHTFTYDPSNPTSLPTESNSMASDQALYSLVALWRYYNNMRSIFDFRTDFSQQEQATIKNLIVKIDSLTELSSKNDVENILDDFTNLKLDRVYISNFSRLVEYLNKFKLSFNEDSYYSDENTTIPELVWEFTQEHALKANDIDVKSLTTNDKTLVDSLYQILINSFNKDDFNTEQIILEKAINQINLLQEKIDNLNNFIKSNLYPYDKLGLKDKANINYAVAQYNQLSEYDKTQITNFEDVLKAKTKIDNLQTAIIISINVGVGVIILTIILVILIRKQRLKKRQQQMPESDE